MRVAWCFSHSAGSLRWIMVVSPLLYKGSFDNIAVGVDPSVAKKWPVAPDVLQVCRINLRQDDLLPVVGSPGDDLALGACDKRGAPEFKTRRIRRGPFKAHPIGRGDIDPVGHGVAALDRFPRIVLPLSVSRLFMGMPADRRGIEEDLLPNVVSQVQNPVSPGVK